MDISIIIPAKNAEKYLDRCLKSLSKALTAARSVESEVLVVDNGSDDKTLMLACKWREKAFPGAVHILQCATPGAAAARNYGISKAKGEYIWIIDADDAIGEDSIRELLKTAREEEADLVMMGAKRIYPDGRRDYLSAVTKKDPNYKSRFVRYGAGPWQMIFRRKWWLERKISFHEGIIHEDMELISALILYTEKFTGVDKPFYLYYQNPESVLHRSKFNPHIFDIFPALTGLYQRFEQAHATEKYYAELEWFFIWNLLIDSAKDFAKFPEGKPGFARSRKMLKKYFPHWRRNRFLREKSLKLRIFVRKNYYHMI